MKPISINLANHIAQETTTLATCWKLVLTNGTVRAFTDYNEDIVVDGVTYLAATGFTRTAIATSADLAVDNVDIDGMLSSDAIAEADIMAGLYDFAAIEIFKVNYANVADGVLKLRRGWLGEVSLTSGQFVAEVRGLAQSLSQSLGDLYSPGCRAKLGDAQCKIAMGDFTDTGMVASVESQQVFAVSALSQPAGYFSFGKLTFTSGGNAGLSMEVKEYIPGRITLVLPMPYIIEAGDGFSVEAGCDKSFATCIARFSNAINFRGEPHVPGVDKMLETSGTLRRG